jgi:hypothetical protein
MAQLNIEFTTLGGREVKYQLTALKRKEAALVFHNTLRTLLSAMISDDEEVSSTAVFVRALQNFDFELFWELASRLLRNATVFSEDKIIEIKSLDNTEYFDDRQDEMYWAVYHAVQANYPKFFSGLMEKLGFSPDLAEVAKANQ